MDQRRVVEIQVPGISIGTGYLLCAGCILSAYHVVQDATGDILCRLLGDYNDGRKGWTASQVVWSNQVLDLVLLQFSANSTPAAPLPAVNRLDLEQGLDCRAYGFPRFRRQEQAGKTSYYPYVAEGWIKPILSKQSGELLIDIKGATPKDMDDWKGMSGSAVFSEANGDLIGVVTKGPEALKGELLQAIALDHVISSYHDFNALLSQQFGQTLSFEESARLPLISPADQDMIEALRHERRGIKRQLDAVVEELDGATGRYGVALKSQRETLVNRLKDIDQQREELGDVIS